MCNNGNTMNVRCMHMWLIFLYAVYIYVKHRRVHAYMPKLAVFVWGYGRTADPSQLGIVSSGSLETGHGMPAGKIGHRQNPMVFSHDFFP